MNLPENKRGNINTFTRIKGNQPQPPLYYFSKIEKRLDEFPILVISKKQVRIRPHAHSFYEFVYVVRGSSVHIHADKKYPIMAGDCFVIHPHEPHKYENPENLYVTNILFKAESIPDIIDQLRNVDGFREFILQDQVFKNEPFFRYKLHLNNSQRSYLKPLIERLHAEQGDDRTGSDTVRKGLFLAVIATILRFFRENIGLQSLNISADTSEKQHLLDKAINFIETNYSSDISINDIAKFVCMSESHLSHIFSRKYGMSIREYLLSFRLDNAMNLLKMGEKNVTEIALDVGFHDAGYFSRQFRKRYGYPPSKIQILTEKS